MQETLNTIADLEEDLGVMVFSTSPREGVVEHNRSERRISHSTDLLVDSRMGAAYAGATNKSGD